jgi:hypothetical protein
MRTRMLTPRRRSRICKPFQREFYLLAHLVSYLIRTIALVPIVEQEESKYAN